MVMMAAGGFVCNGSCHNHPCQAISKSYPLFEHFKKQLIGVCHSMSHNDNFWDNSKASYFGGSHAQSIGAKVCWFAVVSSSRARPFKEDSIASVGLPHVKRLTITVYLWNFSRSYSGSHAHVELPNFVWVRLKACPTTRTCDFRLGKNGRYFKQTGGDIFPPLTARLCIAGRAQFCKAQGTGHSSRSQK